MARETFKSVKKITDVFKLVDQANTLLSDVTEIREQQAIFSDELVKLSNKIDAMQKDIDAIDASTNGKIKQSETNSELALERRISNLKSDLITLLTANAGSDSSVNGVIATAPPKNDGALPGPDTQS